MKLNSNTSRHQGLSLVEVLVTVLILMMVLGLSYRGLSTMLQSKENVPKDIKRWGDIERVFDRVEFDFTNLSWIAPVSPGGRHLYPLMVDKSGSNGALAHLTLSRFSMSDRENSTMDGQLIGYRLNGDVLELLLYPTLYLPLDSRFHAPKIYPLLRDVTEFRVEVMDENQQWLSVYPPLASVENDRRVDSIPSDINVGGAQEAVKRTPVKIAPLPQALRVSLSRKGLEGQVVRIFDRSR